MPKELFHSPTKGDLTFEQVIDELLELLEEEPDTPYAIVVGTDSRASAGELDFVTAVIVHRIGKGGRYFWRRVRDRRPYSLRQKLYREATLSFELAKALMEELSRTPLDYNLEIHVDVGHRGPSREVIDEVVGMIVGSGFQVRTKPEAYGASSVADRHA